MTTSPRHRRDNRFQVGSAMTRAEIECTFACAPFDRLTVELERVWGIDRLPELVDPNMARKYGAAFAHLNACIGAADPATVIAAVENCCKGLRAMDAAARAAGATPLPPEIWEYDLDGVTIAICRDNADWPLIEAATPGRKVFTMRQAVLALQERDGMVAAVLDAFPGATITDTRPRRSKLAEDLNDEIPW